MQGIFIKGVGRPKHKKLLKEAIRNAPDSVSIEATSLFGNEYDGPLMDLPEGRWVYFVGPDPHCKRNFYGRLMRLNGKTIVE